MAKQLKSAFVDDAAHSVGLNSLTPDTLYHYRVMSTDANGKTFISGDGTFVTAPINIVGISVRYSNVRRLTDGSYAVDVTIRNGGPDEAFNASLDVADLSNLKTGNVTYAKSPFLPKALSLGYQSECNRHLIFPRFRGRFRYANTTG